MSTEYKFSSRNMFTGEVIRKGVTITKSSGVLSLTSPKITVYNAATGATVTAEADATVSGGNLYANITAGSTTGSRYAIFKAVDGTNTIKARLDFNVVQG